VVVEGLKKLEVFFDTSAWWAVYIGYSNNAMGD